MNLGLVEFNNCHSETLLSIIEYSIKRNINLNIYLNNIENTWISFYENLYKLNINPIINLKYDIDNFDFIILNTSHIIDGNKDYFNFIKNYKEKTIFIHHYDKPFFKNIKNNLIVTPLLKKFLKKYYNKNSINYFLPIFNTIDLNQKKKYLFCFVGNMRSRNIDLFFKILDLSLEYDFKILYIGNFFGIENFDFSKYKNFESFKNLNSIDFVNKLSSSKYLLPIIDLNKYYFKKRLTGIIPLSINFCIPLIINSKVAKIYNFDKNNSVIYEDNFENIINNILIEKINYQEIKNNLKIFNKKLLSKNYNILDDIFKP